MTDKLSSPDLPPPHKCPKDHIVRLYIGGSVSRGTESAFIAMAYVCFDCKRTYDLSECHGVKKKLLPDSTLYSGNIKFGVDNEK